MQNGVKAEVGNLITKIVRKLAPSKNKQQQMIDQMQKEKELDRQIMNLSKQADKAAKENKTSVRIEDNLDDDENMAKRRVRIDGESEAGGRKRSRSEKRGGRASYDSPTNRQLRNSGKIYETWHIGDGGNQGERRGMIGEKGNGGVKEMGNTKAKAGKTSPHRRIATTR